MPSLPGAWYMQQVALVMTARQRKLREILLRHIMDPDVLCDVTTDPHCRCPWNQARLRDQKFKLEGMMVGWMWCAWLRWLVMNLRAIGGTHLDEFGSHSFATVAWRGQPAIPDSFFSSHGNSEIPDHLCMLPLAPVPKCVLCKDSFFCSSLLQSRSEWYIMAHLFAGRKSHWPGGGCSTAFFCWKPLQRCPYPLDISWCFDIARSAWSFPVEGRQLPPCVEAESGASPYSFGR